MADHAPAPTAAADVLSRRAFLNRLSLILSGLIGLVLSVPILAYLLTPLLRRPPGVWEDVGSVDQFQIGETVEVTIEDPSPLAWAGQTAKTAAWLRRDSASAFTAFAVNCTHLACPVYYARQHERLECPCHEGAFDAANGNVLYGPPPRPLDVIEIEMRGGQVWAVSRKAASDEHAV